MFRHTDLDELISAHEWGSVLSFTYTHLCHHRDLDHFLSRFTV